MDSWQLVHSDGEIVEADDASSISSDWSVMNINESDGAETDVDSEDPTTALTDHSSITDPAPSPPVLQPRSGATARQRLPRRQRGARRRGRAAVVRRSGDGSVRVPPAPPRAASVVSARLALAPAASSAIAAAPAAIAHRSVMLSARGQPPQRSVRRYGGALPSARAPLDRKHTKWSFGGGRIGHSHQRVKVRVA